MLNISFSTHKKASAVIKAVEKVHASHPEAHVINFDYRLKDQSAAFEHTFFKNLISQEEEAVVIEAAYWLAHNICSKAEQASPLVSALAACLLHDYARILSYYFLVKHFSSRHPNLLCILPIYKHSSGVLKEFVKNIGRLLLKKDFRKNAFFYWRQHARIKKLIMSNDQCLLLASDDSGSSVNANTYNAILKELDKRCIPVVGLCTGQIAYEDFSKQATIAFRPDCNIPFNFLVQQRSLSKLRKITRAVFQEGLDKGVFERRPTWCSEKMNKRLLSACFENFDFLAMAYFRTVSSLHELLKIYGKNQKSGRAILVNESILICSAIATMGKHDNITTYGIAPILYMKHPTCRFFPAEYHLNYGEQLSELMTDAGVSPETIHIVGSYQYDRAKHRNKTKDLEYTRRLLPGWTNEKLVIVATEARANQRLEIIPTLDKLASQEGIYTVLKLHPGDSEAEFRPVLDMLGSPENMTLLSACDVLAVIHSADVLVTMGSNLIVEAGVLGIPSISYNYTDTKCPIDFEEEGLCIKARTPQECLEQIHEITSDTPLRAKAFELLKNISRFNGPNDGKSIQRIVDIVLETQ